MDCNSSSPIYAAISTKPITPPNITRKIDAIASGLKEKISTIVKVEDDKVDNHNCTDIPSSTCEEKTRSKSPFEPIDKLTEQKSDLINQETTFIPPEEDAGFIDSSGFDWTYVREVVDDTDFEEMRRERYLTFSCKTEKRVTLRCKRYRKDKAYAHCPYRMLLLGDQSGVRRLYEHKKHNHVIPSIAESNSFSDANETDEKLSDGPTEKMEVTDDWDFVTIIQHPAQLEALRCVHQVTKIDESDETIKFVCQTTQTQKDGDCTYMMIVRPKDNARCLFSYGEHNHEVDQISFAAEDLTYTNQSGEWKFVTEIENNLKLEKFVRINHVVSSGTIMPKQTEFQCQHENQKCPFKMLMRREDDEIPRLYSQGEHNHQVVQMNHPNSEKNAGKIYNDRSGNKWAFMCRIDSDEQLNNVRYEQYGWLGGQTDTTITFRCGNHPPRKGSCPYRMILVSENDERNLYFKEHHNHPLDRSSKSNLTTKFSPSGSGSSTPDTSNDDTKKLAGAADWKLVRVLRGVHELETVRGKHQSAIVQKSDKFISLCCTRWKKEQGSCPYRMKYILRNKKLLEKSVHNHEVVPLTPRFARSPNPAQITTANTVESLGIAKKRPISNIRSNSAEPLPKKTFPERVQHEDTELVYTTPKGEPYSYVCSIRTEEDLERIRCENQVYTASQRENSRWFRCSWHTRNKGLCQYRMLLLEMDDGEMKVYKRNEHNHQIVPITPLFPLDEKPTMLAHANKIGTSNSNRSSTLSSSGMNKVKCDDKLGSEKRNSVKQSPGVPEFKDRDSHPWDYLTVVKGGHEVERIRRAHQMICKGRKGSKRYFRCQLYVEGASNCNYRLVAVEGAKGTYTIFTDNRHNHQVVAIDESNSGRHSFAKEPGLTPQHSNSSNTSQPQTIRNFTNTKQNETPASGFPKISSINLPVAGKQGSFKLLSIRKELNLLASELLLRIVQEERDSVVFMSQDEGGQMLLFTDDNDTITVAEFHGSECVRSDIWPKAGITQFMYAVRGKCFDFFFETPLDVSKRNQVKNET